MLIDCQLTCCHKHKYNFLFRQPENIDITNVYDIEEFFQGRSVCVARWPQLKLLSKELKKNEKVAFSCCYEGKFLSGQMTNFKEVQGS